MKLIVFILIFASFTAFAADPQSIDITLTGKTIAGPNPNDEAAIRKIVAGAVEHLKIKKYQLRTTPVNGGFRVCVDPVPNGGFNYLAGEFSSIAVRESVLTLNLVHRCLSGGN